MSSIADLFEDESNVNESILSAASLDVLISKDDSLSSLCTKAKELDGLDPEAIAIELDKDELEVLLASLIHSLVSRGRVLRDIGGALEPLVKPKGPTLLK
jgi:hypothetical protein